MTKRKKKEEIASGKYVILNAITIKLSPTDPAVHAKVYPNLPSGYTQIEKIDR